MKNEKLIKWLNSASTLEQDALAHTAGTSRQYLYHIASGFRKASAEMGAAIEKASNKLRASSRKRLPKLTRKDICEVCARCPYKKD